MALLPPHTTTQTKCSVDVLAREEVFRQHLSARLHGFLPFGLTQVQPAAQRRLEAAIPS